MGWSDYLGAIGGIAGVAGGLIGGPTGAIISGAGDLAKLGSGLASASSNADVAKTASDALGRTTQLGNQIAQSQQKEAHDAYLKMMGLIPQESDAVSAALEAMGPGYKVDANAVEARAGTLMPQYMFEADQNMTDMFSKDIGSLMRGGIDDSTFGISQRSALAATSADTHRKMYNQAYQDALDYVTKLSSADTASRAQAVSEAKAPYGDAMTVLENIYGHQSPASGLVAATDAAKENLDKSNANISGITAGTQSDQTSKDLKAAWDAIFGPSAGTLGPLAGSPALATVSNPAISATGTELSPWGVAH